MQFTGAIAPADQLPMPGKHQLRAHPNHLHAAVGAPVEDSKRSILEVLNHRGRHDITCMLFECMSVHPLFTVQARRNTNARASPPRPQRRPGAAWSEFVRLFASPPAPWCVPSMRPGWQMPACCSRAEGRHRRRHPARPQLGHGYRGAGTLVAMQRPLEAHRLAMAGGGASIGRSPFRHLHDSRWAN